MSPVDAASQAAADLQEALNTWAAVASSLEVGRGMRAAGERIRPGSMEETERLEAASRQELQAAIAATRRALDDLAMG